MSGFWKNFFRLDDKIDEATAMLKLVEQNTPALNEKWAKDMEISSVPAVCFVWALAHYGILNGMLASKKIEKFTQSLDAEVSWKSFKLCENYVCSHKEFSGHAKELLAPSVDPDTTKMQGIYYYSLITAVEFIGILENKTSIEDQGTAMSNFFNNNEIAKRLVEVDSRQQPFAGLISGAAYFAAFRIGTE